MNVVVKCYKLTLFIFLEFSYEKLTILLNTHVYHIKVAYSTLY